MRIRREITSYLIIALTASVGGSLLFVSSAPAAIDIEPFVNFVDHSIAPRVGEVPAAATASNALPDYFGSGDSETAGDRHMLGFDPEREAPTPAEVRNDADWCLWSALGRSAFQIGNGDTTASDGSQVSPTQILFNNVSSCLQKLISGAPQGQLTALANTLVYLNEVQLVQSQSGLTTYAASNWLQHNGLNYDPATWISWFKFAAQTVPRVG